MGVAFMMRMLRSSLALFALCLITTSLVAAESLGHPKDPRVIDKTLPDLSEFKTVQTAVTTRVSGSLADTPSQPGYLGIHVDANPQGRLVIAQVEPDSPAAKAGLQPGDVVRAVAGQEMTNVHILRDLLQSKAPGETLSLALLRKEQPMQLSATLAATSRPLSLTTPRAIIGVQIGDVKDGVRIEQITSGLPAAGAGLKVGDVILKVDGVIVPSRDKFTNIMSEKRPGEMVAFVYKRDGKDVEVKVKLAAE